METPSTLYDIHVSSGMTTTQVVGKMAEKENRPKHPTRHFTSLSKIFQRGTDKESVIEALAFAYSVTTDVIREANRETKTRGFGQEVRRGRRKI